MYVFVTHSNIHSVELCYGDSSEKTKFPPYVKFIQSDGHSLPPDLDGILQRPNQDVPDVLKKVGWGGGTHLHQRNQRVKMH